MPPLHGRWWLHWPRHPRVFALVFLGFSTVWTVAVAVSIFSEWYAFRQALARGTPVVAGPVEHFQPLPVSGHGEERFTVGGVAFAYSDYAVSSGFNRTSTHGGPIRAGEDVRIHYVGPPTHATIVRLAIRSC